MEKVVCVTGGSGAIGSWLVHLLLNRGYTVHATVQNLNDEAETKHLEALDGAPARLRLFQMELLHYDSVLAAVCGCAGVFHVASPCTVEQVQDPQKELLDPAIKGTLNVLTAAKEAGVRRVVVTSSTSAIVPSPNWPGDVPKRENCWTDVEFCKQKGLWYPLSKTLAEKAAWDFAKETGLDVVVVNPGNVVGPVVAPRLNASMVMFVRLLQGVSLDIGNVNRRSAKIQWQCYQSIFEPQEKSRLHGCDDTYENFFMGSVHFKDVALAHILVYENKSAVAISHYGDFVAKVAELYPEYNVPKMPRDTQPGVLRVKDGSKKLMDLGLQFIPMEKIIKDAVEDLKRKGLIS
ncbi:hypothetical protein V8G54_035543 [Vigna mungo]|uniref:NAD-dependent epimerase/dehydratase domain-containing protein n=1 Tax=Vigna mungo TaxID=3915 RepID=A0AAQ3MGU0_VIGMU